MEAVTRGPYQGVTNIIRFNWHFYVIAGVSIAALVVGGRSLSNGMFWLCIVPATGIFASTIISLFVSHYVYDRSGLYNFGWLREFDRTSAGNIVNIHAGFDETSRILKTSFPEAHLQVFDFYDSARHTEVSIERARKAYPKYNGTVKITTSELPLAESSIDIIFNILALHEVRNRDERIHLLKEQVRALRQGGKIVVVEHLSDMPNFLAYNIGFFHFLSAREWSTNFDQAGLCIDRKFKITPFINVFVLRKTDGNTR